MDIQSHPRWLTASDGSVWLAWGGTFEDVHVARWNGSGVEEPLILTDPGDVQDAVRRGWDATVDAEGHPWIVWADRGDSGISIYARRNADGGWGPRLQVSSGYYDGDPQIIPDTYGNVWIFWFRFVKFEGGRVQTDLWLCRMGRRSGQPTLVARNAMPPLQHATIIQGTLHVLFDGMDNALYAVTGEEHAGFREPVKL